MGNIIKGNITWSGDLIGDSAGGGIYLRGSSAMILNNLIISNGVICYVYPGCGSGGGIYCVGSGSTIISNTIVGNSAANGSGVHVTGGTTITNSIIWNNDISGTPTVTYSVVRGGYPGEGNLDVDPRFVVGPGWLTISQPDRRRPDF